MDYSIRELSEMAGISARTLRYYDKIGLLKPADTRKSGYRYYGEYEVELLQQILFYKERGMKLDEISRIVHGDNFDIMSALSGHLEELKKEQERIAAMIAAVKKTIASMKGEIKMGDVERFEAFKKEMIDKNEETYGAEIRQTHGDTEVDESNKKMLNMSEEEYGRFIELGTEIIDELEHAVTEGISPESETGRKVVSLHKEWLSMTWPKYNVRAHQNLTEMYLADERFKQHYDRQVPGCAEFLKEAAVYWLNLGV